MNSDRFDALIRGGDPGGDRADSDGHDALLIDTQRRWMELSGHRVVVRKRVSIALAAIGLFAVLGGPAIWFNALRSDRNSKVAIAPAVESMAVQSTPAESIAAESVPEVINDNETTRLSQQTGSVPPQETEQDKTQRPGSSSGTPVPTMRMPPTTIPKKPLTNIPRRKRTVDQREGPAQRLADFASFIERAGEQGGAAWRNAVFYLASTNVPAQAAAIEMVPALAGDELRKRAFELVCGAAGPSQRFVLTQWLANESTRALAWDRLVAGASLDQVVELVELAESIRERTQLCRQIAQSPDDQAVGLLVQLAAEPDWRPSVRASAADLNPRHIVSLIMVMRQRNVPLRTSAAFILASVPGQQVDRVVCSMISGGRYQQPAYLVLLSRGTPQARAFLAQAASRPDLVPALVSARLHFSNIQVRLSQWIAESKGADDERSDTTHRAFPETLGGNRRLVFVRTGHQLG